MTAEVAIVGAGQAGVECAWALRAAGLKGPIVLVGDEASMPYQRPPLSKAVIEGTMEPSRLSLRAEDAYVANGVTWIGADAAVRLDTKARTLHTATGLRIDWRSLVLATGARARPLPGLDGPGVFAIRTLADALALRTAVQSGCRLLVVGAGYLGLEVAATASKRGAHVVVVEQAGAILGGRLSTHMADELQGMHATAGVQLRFGVAIANASRDDAGWRIELDSGEVHHADAVLVAAGALPNAELAQQAGLHCDGGIVVDSRGRASCDGVWAIGDCASAPRPQLGGARARVESVFNALAQARTAAADIACAPLPAARTPTFWSDQFGRRLQIAGLAAPGMLDHDIAVPTARGCVVERYRAGVLAVVEAIDSPAEFIKATQRIGRPAPTSAVAHTQEP